MHWTESSHAESDNRILFNRIKKRGRKYGRAEIADGNYPRVIGKRTKKQVPFPGTEST